MECYYAVSNAVNKVKEAEDRLYAKQAFAKRPTGIGLK